MGRADRVVARDRTRASVPVTAAAEKGGNAGPCTFRFITADLSKHFEK